MIKKAEILAILFVVLGLWTGSLEAARTIYVDDDGLADFNNIQAAIDDANDGDTIIVADGIFTGDGNRDIDFLGKAITLRSENGPENCIIDCNGTTDEAHRGFYFHEAEEANSIVWGLTIVNGCIPGGFIGSEDPWHQSPNNVIGGGIYCELASPSIINCVVRDCITEYGGGIGCVEASAVIIDCMIADCYAGGIGIWRSGGYGAGIALIKQSKAKIINCTIRDNHGWWNSSGGGIICLDSNPVLTNCTLTGNKAFCCGGGMYSGASTPTVSNCILWGNSPSQISGTVTVSYSDVQGGYTGLGNIYNDPYFADANTDDYHLKSKAGRWEPNCQTWVQDANTSPCIDAGNPNSPIGLEPFPNGGRINMGAYGGTPEASKSYFGQPVCETIVAGDVNGDCKVNFLDFRLMALHWCEDNNP
jgi:hypothetical protein